MGRRGKAADPAEPADGQFSLTQFIEDLNAEGVEVMGDSNTGRLLVTALRGQRVNPPIERSITAEQLRSTLDTMATARTFQGNAADRRQQAYQLFLANFEENLEADAFPDQFGPPRHRSRRGCIGS